MIEKLKNIPIDMNGEPSAVWLKINELVDAVNILQAQVAILEEHAHPTAKTEPTDPYAEQRKWIGYFCRFWDSDEDYCCYGLLTKIYDISPYCYECNRRTCYEHCKPVKDDIIYKGGDNDRIANKTYANANA